MSNRRIEIEAAIIRVRRLTTLHKYRQTKAGIWQVRIHRADCKPYWRLAFNRRHS